MRFGGYAAPSSFMELAGLGGQNPVKFRDDKFIFLDCGKWKDTHRDFGLIYGRHVYLCSFDDGTHSNYTPVGLKFNDEIKTLLDSFPDRLDKNFFAHMSKGEKCVRIVNWSVADWGDDDEYDDDGCRKKATWFDSSISLRFPKSDYEWVLNEIKQYYESHI